MDKQIEKRLKELDKKIDNNLEKIIETMNKLHSHEGKINANSERIGDNLVRIQKNSLVLEIIGDYKKQNKICKVLTILFALCWIFTIIAFLLK